MKRGRKNKYNFNTLLVNGAPMCGEYTIISCAINWGKKYQPTWRFKSTREDGVYKVWRVK